jgi:hypothetical protein
MIFFVSIKLNWNLIQFNNWIKIQLKKNRMQIGEGIKNQLVNMVLQKKKVKNYIQEIYNYMPFYLVIS